MKINKLKKLPNGKYKIYFEDGDSIVTYDEVILNNNLLYSKEVDNNLLNELTKQNDYYDIYNKCINLISKRIRSEKEVRKYLSKYTMDNSIIDDIIIKLKDINLINDLYFTKAFISDKINLSNIGPFKIIKELEDNDIDYNMIMNELGKIDKDLLQDKIDKYIQKKINSNSSYSGYILKQKIMSELINNGYPKDMIIISLDRYEIKSNIDKEFNKQYKKLSQKYSGEELYYNLKNKLYQKGYKAEEINETIKKMDI